MPGPISIALAGDIFLGEEPRFTLDGPVREVFHGADLVIANLESPITARERAVGSKGCLKSAPAAAKLLRDWGVDVVSLANNHVFDHGWEGFEDTLRALDQVGIKYLGAGEKLAAATNNTRLRAEHIRESLEEYPGALIMPPASTFDNIDAIETKGPPLRQWSLRFDLWTREEGLSDLSMELTLIDSDGECLTVELDGIHVL